MNSPLHILLATTPDQATRLETLQKAFAEVCNSLSPLVQQTRCWNRVALHHLAYRGLRERFPFVGSQMICNAIYSVSRACRTVLQHPQSPFNVNRNPDQALPRIQFLPDAPVYFDRHTVSLKGGQLSMYTLDGRMHFQLRLAPEDEARFQREKLREIVLLRSKQGFQLTFWFSRHEDQRKPAPEAEMPEYLVVHPAEPQQPERMEALPMV